MLVSLGGTPTWRLHTGLCKFVQNISTNVWSSGKHTDLKLGKLSYSFISYNIIIGLVWAPQGNQEIAGYGDHSPLVLAFECHKNKLERFPLSIALKRNSRSRIQDVNSLILKGLYRVSQAETERRAILATCWEVLHGSHVKWQEQWKFLA